MLARTLCIANHRGGVGKTATAVNLASGLAKAGKRTLLIDLDPQCNATLGLGLAPSSRHPLAAGVPFRLALSDTYVEQLAMLPGSRNVADIRQLVDGQASPPVHLHHHLQSEGREFDIVLFDCPPSLSGLTAAALASSDEVLIPIQCECFALEGIAQMIELIKRVMCRSGRPPQFAGVLLTMYDPGLELAREVDREVRDFFGEVTFDTIIPHDAAVAEARGSGRAVIDRFPRARGARAYIELCMEVLER